MPKRPCALVITEDDSTIIAADKFGDVYSLPLLFSESKDRAVSKPTSGIPESAIAKPFVPSANELTIHSQRNRKALENQKKQTNKHEKTGPTFEHTLLLGHVSMLTDVVLATLGERKYILTADRDEHIRISRGILQTHITEAFCLGHTEFVNRLCIPDTRPEILISAGGDDYIFVWDWVAGQLLSRANLKSHVGEVMGKLKPKSDNDAPKDHIKIAVSQLSHVRSETSGDLVIILCEG